jgi:PAS domain-containing protein
LRLRDVREHPAFGGFPQHHPLMTSFMGIPIRYKGHAVGNLYVANKRGAAEFTERDEQLIEMLADGVGVAIETARRTAEGLERTWLETVVDQIPEGVLLMDAEGRVTIANRFMRSLASVDTPATRSVRQPDAIRPAISLGRTFVAGRPPIVKALTDKMTTDGHEFMRGGPTVEWCRSSSVRHRSGQRTEPSPATMILQDASTLKELERMREEWATIVAHDLQQPIHTILLRSDLLASGPLTAERAGRPPGPRRRQTSEPDGARSDGGARRSSRRAGCRSHSTASIWTG